MRLLNREGGVVAEERSRRGRALARASRRANPGAQGHCEDRGPTSILRVVDRALGCFRALLLAACSKAKTKGVVQNKPLPGSADRPMAVSLVGMELGCLIAFLI